MNPSNQAIVDRLNTLFALPPAQWTAVEDEAFYLLEQLAEALGDNDPLVQDLDRELSVAQAASKQQHTGDAKGLPTTAAPAAPPAELPPADTALFQETTNPLTVALRALADQGRFEIRQRLQAGNFSAGYSALDRQTQAHVVVKLPTDVEHTWLTRFQECDAALAAEAAILPLASQVIAAAPAGSARPVAHVAAGTLSIPTAWPYPVHWLAQRFAQGQRVSDSVPWRDAQEAEGLHILSQVTTMVQRLYAAQPPLAHRDLKEDALFWDGQQVEVIDWNRATENPSPEDFQREFAGLQQLVSTIFFGPTQRWSEATDRFADVAHADAWALFVAVSGRPLSRGVRGLIFRSLAAAYLDSEMSTPTPKYPGALTTVDALHDAIAEQHAYWTQPSAALPKVAAPTPRALAALLDQVSVELQRPVAQRRTFDDPLDWLLDAYAQAQTEAINHLKPWLSVPENLRTVFPKIEEIWFWLSDVWPLVVVVPLSKLSFRHVARRQDDWLVKLIKELLTDQFTDAATTARQLAAVAPAPLAALLELTAQSAEAYLKLATLEQALDDPQLDYEAALRELTQVREVIPFEPRTLKVQRKLTSGEEISERTLQLQPRLYELSRCSPQSQTQRELLAVMERLRELGGDDPRYAMQQQTVALIDQAEQALAAAREAAEAGDWATVRTNLAAWASHADLRAVAPDVAVQLAALFATAEERPVARRLGDFLAQVQAALRAGDVILATTLCEDARQTFAGNPSILDRVAALEQALTPLVTIIIQFQQDPTATRPRLDPAKYPSACYPLVAQINALIGVGQALTQAKTIEASQQALQTAHQLATDVPPPLAEVQRQLIAAATTQVLARLRERLTTGTPLTPDECQVYELALQYLLASETGARVELLTIQAWLTQQHAERQNQAQAELHARLKDLGRELEHTRYAIHEQIHEEIHHGIVYLKEAQEKLASNAELTAINERLGTLARSTALDKVNERLNVLATNAELARVTGPLATNAELAALSTQLEGLATNKATIDYLVWLAKESDLAKQVSAIDERLNRLSKSDESLAATLVAIVERLNSVSKELAGIKTRLDTDADERSKGAQSTIFAALDNLPKPVLWSGIGVSALVVVLLFAFVLVPRVNQFASGGPTATSAAATIGTPGTAVAVVVTSGAATATKPTTIAGISVTTKPIATTEPTPTEPTPTIEPVTPTPTPVAASEPSPITEMSPLAAQLGQSVSLPFGSAAISGTKRLVLGDTSIPLTVTVGTSVFIPETLLLGLPYDFTLPLTGTLQVDGQPSIPLRIEPSVLTVDEIRLIAKESEFGPRREIWAFLWQTPNTSGNVLSDTIKLRGIASSQPNFAVLQQGDRVKLLGGKGEFYEVEIVTNQADGKQSIGLHGWIRKTLVHDG